MATKGGQMANRDVIREFIRKDPQTAMAMVGLHARLLEAVRQWIIIGSFWGNEIECLDCPEEANRIRQDAKGEAVHQWQIDRLRVLSCVSCRDRLP